jgi:hypothetical protein
MTTTKTTAIDPKMAKLDTTRLHQMRSQYNAMDQSYPTTKHMITRINRELKKRGKCTCVCCYEAREIERRGI